MLPRRCLNDLLPPAPPSLIISYHTSVSPEKWTWSEYGKIHEVERGLPRTLHISRAPVAQEFVFDRRFPAECGRDHGLPQRLNKFLLTSSQDRGCGWGEHSREPCSTGRQRGASDRSSGSVGISHTQASSFKGSPLLPTLPFKAFKMNLFLLNGVTSQPHWYLQSLSLQKWEHSAFDASLLVF